MLSGSEPPDADTCQFCQQYNGPSRPCLFQKEVLEHQLPASFVRRAPGFNGILPIGSYHFFWLPYLGLRAFDAMTVQLGHYKIREYGMRLQVGLQVWRAGPN